MPPPFEPSAGELRYSDRLDLIDWWTARREWLVETSAGRRLWHWETTRLTMSKRRGFPLEKRSWDAWGDWWVVRRGDERGHWLAKDGSLRLVEERKPWLRTLTKDWSCTTDSFSLVFAIWPVDFETRLERVLPSDQCASPIPPCKKRRSRIRIMTHFLSRWTFSRRFPKQKA